MPEIGHQAQGPPGVTEWLQFPEIPVRSEDSILKSFCELFLSSIATAIYSQADVQSFLIDSRDRSNRLVVPGNYGSRNFPDKFVDPQRFQLKLSETDVITDSFCVNPE